MATQQDVQNAFAEFKEKFQPNENANTNEGRLLVTSKTITIQVDDFKFEISTRLLPKHMRLVARAKSLANNDDFDYDALMQPFAEFMESVCTDKRYDTAFWLQYNEDTGYLPSIIEYVVNSCEKSKPQITTFR